MTDYVVNVPSATGKAVSHYNICADVIHLTDMDEELFGSVERIVNHEVMHAVLAKTYDAVASVRFDNLFRVPINALCGNYDITQVHSRLRMFAEYVDAEIM